ncbi:hypothetical protein BU52_05250 [Streptomyces toyocaensis]|uniref:Uncharacterized protein n=1 Tax=Streptomyces toyocaensis TaxID=55952 RepID=A0A081XY10_STRTO|nr:DUF6233 domain-containing protein [Streptomyces toyocaensis]KES08433.1 hypothetical protein BU52_05250 [Streptomyces toyocaensis]
MFDDLPPDLDRLHTLRVWHTLWLQRIDAKIAALTRRQAEQERGRRNRPAPPDWIVELGIGDQRPPLQVHAGDCHMAGRRRRSVDREEARRLLAAGLKACGHCRPDSLLGITDLSGRPALAAAAVPLIEHWNRPVATVHGQVGPGVQHNGVRP